MGDHLLDLRPFIAAGLKILPYTVLQRNGLAHIDDPPLRVLIDIDAGRGRKS